MGKITAGIVTTATLVVGTGGTVITTSSNQRVGIGTLTPRAKFDVEGHARLKTYSENVGFATVVSNVVTIDLSEAQTFICTATANITQFTLKNIPSGSSSFTLRIDQDSSGGRSVGIDTFKNTGGTAIPVYWPGNVVPIVTTTASRSDIYSFKIFDGDNPTSVGFYGVVGGQNFQN